jgi:signal transduction histidine kinase
VRLPEPVRAFSRRLSPSHLLAGRRPSRVRLRLTALYGGLFIVSGAVLLAITYLLVSHSRQVLVTVHQGPGSAPAVVGTPAPGTAGLGNPTQGIPGLLNPGGIGTEELTRQLRAEGVRQHQDMLHRLLVQSGIALAIMVVISIVLGWLVAGRILRPLRTMTTTIQQISARNLHERLAADGPRDEIKDLSDTVDGLLERLETALGAHKRVVANAAHELRTPITLERALLEETLMDPNASLTSFRSTFERLLVITTQQGRLLESLLTLATSERGLDRMEPVDLAAATGQVILVSRTQAARRQLRIESDIRPAFSSGDPALVERLVANLLDNAMGYNIPGGWIRVSTGTRDGRAVVSVFNTGKAIQAEQVGRLFEPFHRLDRAGEQDGHHGLGLSIVRAIAAAHHAVITAHARPEGGLAVEVAFPTVAALTAVTDRPRDPGVDTGAGALIGRA